jgi:hypothetical protein
VEDLVSAAVADEQVFNQTYGAANQPNH